MPSSYMAQPPRTHFLLHALPRCFVSFCHFFCPPTLQPLCLLSLRHPSFILHLFVSICLPASCLIRLSPALFVFLRNPPFFLFGIVAPCESSVFLFLCCSGPTDSTSLITRARAALSSFSRPKTWKRSGWNSSAWPCEWAAASQQCQDIKMPSAFSPVIQVRPLDLWGTLSPSPFMRNLTPWHKDEQTIVCANTKLYTQKA